MGYKLEIEKSHRETKGGNRPRAIQKHTPSGRTLRIHQATDEDVDGNRTVSEAHFVHTHATRKNKVRRLYVPYLDKYFRQLPT